MSPPPGDTKFAVTVPFLNLQDLKAVQRQKSKNDVFVISSNKRVSLRVPPKDPVARKAANNFDNNKFRMYNMKKKHLADSIFQQTTYNYENASEELSFKSPVLQRTASSSLSSSTSSLPHISSFSATTLLSESYNSPPHYLSTSSPRFHNPSPPHYLNVSSPHYLHQPTNDYTAIKDAVVASLPHLMRNNSPPPIHHATFDEFEEELMESIYTHDNGVVWS